MIRFLAIAAALFLHAEMVCAQSTALLERGKYLVEGVVACGNCHTPREQGTPIFERGLSGGMAFNEELFTAYAPNISPDPETGIGNWSNAQIGKAIREGVRPDGTIIGPPMPVQFYRGISDQDLAAIVAYIRAQPPVKNSVPKSQYRMPLPVSYGSAVGRVNPPRKSEKGKLGEYLVRIAHCMDCHTPVEKGRLDRNRMGVGGREFKGPWGVSVAGNITPHESGLKRWSNAEIAQAIHDGVDRDGNSLKPPMAFAWYRNINDEDMRALIGYLRSIRPLSSGGN